MSFKSFHDINEKFNSLINDHFNFGNIKGKIVVNKAPNLGISASYACNSANLILDAESMIPFKNVNFVAKFLSTNMLTLECNVENFPFKNSGTHFSIINDFSIKYHQALAKHYKTGKNYHVGGDCRFITFMTKPIATIHTLFGYDNYFIGGKVCIDSHEKFEKDPSLDFCIGYSVPDFTFHGLLKHHKTSSYEASAYQRINDNVQCGVQIKWEKMTNNVNVGICAKMDLSDRNNTFVKFKTNNVQSLGLAYGFDFMNGIQIALSGEFSKSNVNFGISSTVEFD